MFENLKSMIALSEATNEDDAADKVLKQLKSYMPDHAEELDEHTIETLTRVIKERLKAGWTAAEIVAEMKNMEEINPDLEEDFALARMKKINDTVKARLAAS